MVGPTTEERVMNETQGTNNVPAPSKLKYKHAIMLAKMVQPYIREFSDIQREARAEQARAEQARAESDESDGESTADDLASNVGLIMFERLLMQATDDVTKFIASVMDVSIEEVEEVELDDLLTWFEETWEYNNVPGFIERVRGLMQRALPSSLPNQFSESTDGQTES